MKKFNYDKNKDEFIGNIRDRDADSCLFSDVLDSWLEFKSNEVKGSTLLKYENLIEKHIKPELGKCKIRDINNSSIDKFAHIKLHPNNDKTARSLSSGYIKTMLIIIKSAYLYATSRNLQVNTTIFKKDVNANSRSKIILNEKTVVKLEKICLNKRNDAPIAIMLASQAGLRIGEICALKWEDIDLDNKILYVRNNIARVKCPGDNKRKSSLTIDTPKSTTSCRLIPITNKLHRFLQRISYKDCNQFVLTNSTKFLSPRTLEYRFHAFLKNNEIGRFNFHMLRHTFATRCIERDVEFKALSEILGHADIKTTLDTYVHLTIEGKRNQLEKLNR